MENTYDIPQGTGPQVLNVAEITDREPKDKGLVRRWITEIKTTQRRFEDYYKRVDRIVSRYRDERERLDTANDTNVGKTRRMNMYWSMVQTERSHLYMEPGKPYVHRRFDDNDAAARDASMIIQRCLTYSHDESNSHHAMRSAVTNYQLAARGVTWVRYSPTFELRTSEDRTYIEPGTEPDKAAYPDGFELGTDDAGDYVREKYQHKTGEYCEVVNVNIKDFLHEMTSDWSQCKWVARRVAMTYDEIKDRFGKRHADGIPKKAFRATNVVERDGDNMPDDYQGLFVRADVWEIWSKESRKVIWINTDYDIDVLDEQDDIYGLHDFFPCPRPMFGTLTPDSLIPVPDYYILQDVFQELDRITERLKLLHEACRVAGVYDQSAGDDIKLLVSETDENRLIPVDNWAAFQEQGGLRGVISFLPLNEIIAVIKELMVARRVLAQELYEISGLADITRGASDCRETAKAQEIKGDFATMRLRERQLLVAEHYREILQIKAELIAKHYSDEEIATLASVRELFTKRVPVASPGMQAATMPGQPPAPTATPQPQQFVEQFDEDRFAAAMEVLRAAGQRQFRIKIDTETLGGQRKSQELSEKVQFLEAMGQFMQQAVTASESVPNAAPLMAKLLLFGVRGFKIGRQLEQEIEETLEILVQQGTGKPPEQNGKPPEELQLEREKLELEKHRLQLEAQRLQIDMMNAQTQQQEKLGRLQVDAQSRSRDADQREAKISSDAQRDMAQIQQQKYATDTNAQLSLRAQQIQREKAQGDAQIKRTQIMANVQDGELKRLEAERDRALKAAEFEINTEVDLAKQARDLQSRERIADKQRQQQSQGGDE